MAIFAEVSDDECINKRLAIIWPDCVITGKQ